MLSREHSPSVQARRLFHSFNLMALWLPTTTLSTAGLRFGG
jgi:hypothetical protein